MTSMSVEIWAAAVQHNVARYRNHPDMKRVKEILRDPDLNEAARQRRLGELLPELRERYYKVLSNNGSLLAGAREQYVSQMAVRVQQRAAFEFPRRASDIREMTKGMDERELREVIAEAARTRDLAAAAGLRTTVRALPDEKLRAELTTEIDKIGLEGQEQRLGYLLVAQSAAAEFEILGPEQDEDGLMLNPGKALMLDRLARNVPVTTDGEVCELPEAEAERLRALVAEAPPEPALPTPA